MSREADIVNTIKDIKKEAELITVLKDIKNELTGIRMELEYHRPVNIELANDTTKFRCTNGYWLRGYYPQSDVTIFRCTNCDHEIHFDGNKTAPNKSKCPKCEAVMICVI